MQFEGNHVYYSIVSDSGIPLFPFQLTGTLGGNFGTVVRGSLRAEGATPSLIK